MQLFLLFLLLFFLIKWIHMSTLLFLTCFSQADKHLSTQTSLSHQYILSWLDTNTLLNKPDKKKYAYREEHTEK